MVEGRGDVINQLLFIVQSSWESLGHEIQQRKFSESRFRGNRAMYVITSRAVAVFTGIVRQDGQTHSAYRSYSAYRMRSRNERLYFALLLLLSRHLGVSFDVERKFNIGMLCSRNNPVGGY